METINEIKTIYEEVLNLYNLVYGFLSKTNESIKSKSLSNSELCDYGYFCREMENLFDELRKEVKARKEICGQIISYNIVKESINDPTINTTVYGEFSSGTSDMKMEVALPAKGTEEYKKIVTFFLKNIFKQYIYEVAKLISFDDFLSLCVGNEILEKLLKEVSIKITQGDIFKLDWKQVTELCTKLLQEGKSIPEGFGKQYPKYFVTYKKKNNEKKESEVK